MASFLSTVYSAALNRLAHLPAVATATSDVTATQTINYYTHLTVDLGYAFVMFVIKTSSKLYLFKLILFS